MVLDLLTTLLVGGLGGGLVSVVVFAWKRHFNPVDPDLSDVASEVAAQGKALRRLTMQRVRAYAQEPPSSQPEPGTPQEKAALRARVFGRKLQ